MANWVLMEQRQRSWIEAAISYHKAKVAIYKLMVEEWEQELAEIAREKGASGESVVDG